MSSQVPTLLLYYSMLKNIYKLYLDHIISIVAKS